MSTNSDPAGWRICAYLLGLIIVSIVVGYMHGHIYGWLVLGLGFLLGSFL
jgi:hypothetical protein